MKFKKIVKKAKTGARKGLLQGSKTAVIGGKITTGVGKAGNLITPNSGNQVIAAGRALTSAGRLGRETSRGNTAGNRNRVNVFAANAKNLQYA